MSLVTVNVDDTSPNVTYNGSWLRLGGIGTVYDLFDATDSWSKEQGDTAVLVFYGTYLEYWSNTENTRGPCQLTLDGAVVTTVSAYAPVDTGLPILLWTDDNLALKMHTLEIKVLEATNPNRCEVDRFVVGTPSYVPVAPTTTPKSSPTTAPPPASSSIATSGTISTPGTASTVASSLTGTSTSSGPSSRPTGSSLVAAGISVTLPAASNSGSISFGASSVSRNVSSPLPVGVIIGIALGVVALNILFLFLWWWYRRSRKPTIEPFTENKHSSTQALILNDRPASSSQVTPFYPSGKGGIDFNPTNASSPVISTLNVNSSGQRLSATTVSLSDSAAIRTAYRGIRESPRPYIGGSPSRVATNTIDSIDRSSIVSDTVPPAYNEV